MNQFIYPILVYFCFMLAGCQTPTPTLYQQIGGDKTLTTVYGLALTRIYNDPRIGHYFTGVPKNQLRDKLVAQTCQLIGGPCQYDGKSMIEAHKELAITDADFYVLVEHVQKAMRDVGLTFAQENQILQVLAPMKSQIVYQ